LILPTTDVAFDRKNHELPIMDTVRLLGETPDIDIG
jgi:hypothetical protein